MKSIKKFFKSDKWKYQFGDFHTKRNFDLFLKTFERNKKKIKIH